MADGFLGTHFPPIDTSVIVPSLMSGKRLLLPTAPRPLFHFPVFVVINPSLDNKESVLSVPQQKEQFNIYTVLNMSADKNAVHAIVFPKLVCLCIFK